MEQGHTGGKTMYKRIPKKEYPKCDCGGYIVVIGIKQVTKTSYLTKITKSGMMVMEVINTDDRNMYDDGYECQSCKKEFNIEDLKKSHGVDRI